MEAGGWSSHLCGVPAGDFALALGQGYFVKTSRAVSWSYQGTVPSAGVPLSLAAGWNAIGLPGRSDAYTAATALSAVNTSADASVAREIVRWDAGGWDGYLLDLPAIAFSLQEGKGAFIRVSQAAEWTP
jgi:hypothetical protein